MAKRIKWSEEEDSFLKENYNQIPFEEIQKQLPNRSENSIRWRAKHILNLAAEKNKSWSKKELELLNSDLPIKEIAELTGRTATAINKKRAIERARTAKTVDLSKYFDLSAIERDVPVLDKFSVSSQYFALLASMDVGESFEFPTEEKSLLRNQIILFPDKKFVTKKWTDKTRRAWRVK